MLLGADRLFSLAPHRRLPRILAESRKYQNQVSTQLAEQVLAALYELVRGFQAADSARKDDLLRDVLRDVPNDIYAGLLRVLLRLVFLLYAEDRSLLSSSAVYTEYYSVLGLFDHLRADAGRYPDTMDSRYGAWAQLLTLFRLIHDGGRQADFVLLARKGYLFDPDQYPFLEGRAPGSKREPGVTIAVPRVSDGVVWRILQNLLILNGERLSYRTLDVEQIGSVYETMMGFGMEVARGRSIAIRPGKSHGAPTTIDLDALLTRAPAERAAWFAANTDQKVEGKQAAALKEARTPEDVVAALDRKIARAATPNIVPPGSMILQPSDERRKSGSHYTPRSLTEPIVRTTLRPILERLGPDATPAAILDLKVCDPAMGSGAFLVEACRQLADRLVDAWHHHAAVPPIPPDEDELLFAQRLIAQRCLYGVDKNPMAVNLAKLSLWLATLAKDHPFTFLDHALREGDSLVGLTRHQIESFHWQPDFRKLAFMPTEQIASRIGKAIHDRQAIREAADATPEPLLQQKLGLVNDALNPVRFYGDLVIASFFGATTDKARKALLEDNAANLAAHIHEPDYLTRYPDLRRIADNLRTGPKSVSPFHWEIEFPEVFDRDNPGFDLTVGNPPFAGVTSLSESTHDSYTDWIRNQNERTGGKCDLVAFFFRSVFFKLRTDGCFGLIATNTIAQGDTRQSGLMQIRKEGGEIYSATKRLKWPGQAAVVVSVVHVCRGVVSSLIQLNGQDCCLINSFLFDKGGDDQPATLHNRIAGVSKGVVPYGNGFVIDDGLNGTLSSEDVAAACKCDAQSMDRVINYIGGEEVNNSPNLSPTRQIVYLSDLNEHEAREFRGLWNLIEKSVKPGRYLLKNQSGADRLKRYWWQYQYNAESLTNARVRIDRMLVTARVSPWMSWSFLPSEWIFSEQLVVAPTEIIQSFSILQSRPHEIWARFFGSSMKDDLRYTPSDCFETFPFPKDFESNPTLEAVGQAYYEFRADLMVRNDEGLTKTYNRFHDPDEPSPDIARLRELHAAMDRAVLNAYGWTDLEPSCEFLLDYDDEADDDDPATASPTPRRRKKPWRHRWPDDFRDEVLARLLELNRLRAHEESLLSATPTPKTKAKPKPKPRTPKSKPTPDDQSSLPGL